MKFTALKDVRFPKFNITALEGDTFELTDEQFDEVKAFNGLRFAEYVKPVIEEEKVDAEDEKAVEVFVSAMNAEQEDAKEVKAKETAKKSTKKVAKKRGRPSKKKTETKK